MIIDADGMEIWAKQVLRWPDNRRWKQTDRNGRFRSVFGAGSEVVADIWNRIEADAPIDKDAKPKHLLWALVLLKVYQSDEVHCALVGWPSAPTFRKWAWYFVERIAMLKDGIIILANRFDGLDSEIYTHCFISVDGMDCPVNEPWPFNPEMYSEKFNGPGLKYEVAVCIKTGHIVWINGPFLASINDFTVFIHHGLGQAITQEEGVEVDSGYLGDNRFMQPHMGISSKERKQKAVVRGRQEGVNGRLKVYSVLRTHFHHYEAGPNSRNEMMAKHKLCFEAVAVITQLKISTGEPIFKDEVEYDVSYY
jgi:hypothetical protein